MIKYRHYKGGVYFILVHATQEATGEKVVVYQAIDGLNVWVRPASEFYGKVDVNGRMVDRFERIR